MKEETLIQPRYENLRILIDNDGDLIIEHYGRKEPIAILKEHIPEFLQKVVALVNLQHTP